MSQHVSREGRGRGEGSGAEVAAEGPLARVHAQVVLHVGLLDEALGAAGALVGPVARVDALVAREQRVVQCRVAAEAAAQQPATHGLQLRHVKASLPSADLLQCAQFGQR